jgi:hypothetical protein
MSNLQKPLRERVERLALKHRVSIQKVEEIELAMWDFVRTCISEGEGRDPEKYENILVKYLGTFHVLKRKMDFFDKNIENDKQARRRYKKD